jgi:hypothetical protein
LCTIRIERQLPANLEWWGDGLAVATSLLIGVFGGLASVALTDALVALILAMRTAPKGS